MSHEFDEPPISPSVVFDVDDHLGRMYAVPDGWWGFEAEGREDHPGACVLEIPERGEWNLLKGTGADDFEKLLIIEWLIHPTAENGLRKNTIFRLKPRPFRNHKLRNLVPDRVMGRLSRDDLAQLQAGMLRQFGRRG